MMECEIFRSISIGQENKGVDVIDRLRSSASIPASNEPGSCACEDIYKKWIREEGLPSYHHLIFYLIPIHFRVSGKIYLINRQMFENKEVGNEPEKICACFGHPDRFCS